MFVCGVGMRLFYPKKIAEFYVQKNMKVHIRLNKTEERSKNTELFFGIHLKINLNIFQSAGAQVKL